MSGCAQSGSAARREDRIRQLADELGEAVPVRCDVTDPAQVAATVRTATDAFGRIDVLVNNAGQGLQAPIEEIDPGITLSVIPGTGAYASSKAGLDQLSAVARADLASAGLAVSTMYPWQLQGLTGRTDRLIVTACPT